MSRVEEEATNNLKPANDEGDEKKVPETLKEFLKPTELHVVLEKRWGLFTILAGIVYSYHLVWTITGVDAFTDISRFNKCGDATNADESSAIFDTALGLVAVFHMIEWIR